MEILILYGLLCLIPAAIANSKGRSGLGWFVIAILLSPLIAGIIVALMSNQAVAEQRHAELVAAASGSPATAGAIAFVPSVRVPPEGMPSWQRPDPGGPSTPINGAVHLAVLQRVDDWAQVKGSNGWVGWVDGRRLMPLAAPPDPGAG